MMLSRRTLGLAGLSGLGLGLAGCTPRAPANGATVFNAVDVHPADYPTVNGPTGNWCATWPADRCR